MDKNILKDIQRRFFTKTEGIEEVDLDENNNYYIIKQGVEYGVAIENKYNHSIDEMFANARIRTLIINYENKRLNLLFLSSELLNYKNEFASFCAHFVNLGEYNKNREEIQKDPLAWWERWSELLGNKMKISNPYSVFGEILTIKKLVEKGEEDVLWGGSEYKNLDIHTSKYNYEVKTTINRFDNEVTISSQFQLDPEKKPVKLIFIKLDETNEGKTINNLLEELDKLEYDIREIEYSLEKMGYYKNSRSRNIKYEVYEIREYSINEKFPLINEKSFIDGKIPEGVKKIWYNVGLDNLEYKKWE